MYALDLTGHFLIAMPAMSDPYFSGTLIYVCEHNAEGTLGVIVNRPLDMTLKALFAKVDLELTVPDLELAPVYFGGPVHTDRGFVLHRPVGAWQSTMPVTDGVALTSSRDILQALGQAGEPHEVIVTLGYAGWSAGQIESELAQNAWLSVPASADVLFATPFQDRLLAAMDSLGISYANLAAGAGHA